jgi:CDP-4-dehydro-6-deoxyglucose reductase
MSQWLTLSRAARLVGTTRAALQKKIKDGELATFEGQVSAEELLRAFPQARLEDDATLERLAQIRETAFSRRLRERILPDPEVLLTRLAELGRELAAARRQLSRHRDAVAGLQKTLAALEEGGGETQRVTRALRAWLRDALAAGAETEEAESLMAMDEFLRVVAANVRLLPSGREFLVEGSGTILEAALRAGLSLNYGCSNGACGLCKARVVSGQVKRVRPHDYVLSEVEKTAGYALLCANTAVTDIVIEAGEAGGARDIPRQHIVAHVRRIAPLAPDIRLLHLQTPRSQRLRFLAGQSVELGTGSGLRAAYPIASCPCDDRNIEFHVRRMPGDEFAQHVFAGLRPSETVTLDGPGGEFVLAEDSTRPLLFVACDTGFAPIKSLIEHAMALDEAESIHLYWLACGDGGQYLANLCRSWGDALDNFRYTPLDLALAPSGRPDPEAFAGAVQRIAMDRPDLAECDVYVSGPPETAREIEFQLLERGAARERLHVRY